MTASALALVLTAACLHAGWNFIAKRCGGGAVFLWLLTIASSIVYLPLGMWVWISSPRVASVGWLLIAVSSLIHVAYFLSLQRGYRVGDLSLVYPLARGTGPLLAAAAGIILLGERVGPLAIAGGLTIGVGIFLLSGGGGSRHSDSKSTQAAIFYGLTTGMLIATYTVVDKIGVGTYLVPPILYDWLSNLGRTLLLAPYGVTRLPEVRAEWRRNWRGIMAIAVMSPLAYILVLVAMTYTPLAYVAPAREMSILIGTVLGVRLLAEANAKRRVAGAIAMIAGIVALAIG